MMELELHTRRSVTLKQALFCSRVPVRHTESASQRKASRAYGSSYALMWYGDHSVIDARVRHTQTTHPSSMLYGHFIPKYSFYPIPTTFGPFFMADR